MKVLMLVATSVATDTRVLREARALAEAGHGVHIVGRSVPTDWTPPAGITVSSVGTSSVFRAEGGASLAGQARRRRGVGRAQVQGPGRIVGGVERRRGGLRLHQRLGRHAVWSGRRGRYSAAGLVVCAGA